MKGYTVAEVSLLLPSAMTCLMLCHNCSHLAEAQRKYLSLTYKGEKRELTSDT
jgi:hypothetical protein